MWVGSCEFSFLLWHFKSSFASSRGLISGTTVLTQTGLTKGSRVGTTIMSLLNWYLIKKLNCLKVGRKSEEIPQVASFRMFRRKHTVRICQCTQRLKAYGRSSKLPWYCLCSPTLSKPCLTVPWLCLIFTCYVKAYNAYDNKHKINLLQNLFLGLSGSPLIGSTVPMQGVQVWSLIRELESHILHGVV